ncbi:3',5'-cyclic adenosine monophosphate phosphodiesterase CpdA [Streptomyces griseorubiginosus]|uniref:3',5'-cyclic adenosine monophosphate phosphodiesterase CpdA n=2 Tax=Streptomyces griseorubiginosus TaxID=67304 RepID=A0AAI8L0I7_9ACTN|nr:3',5'-cyclic adenosine monophosphate phosphodiesterase CpdA [Streptomyces griseorubiginosus]
MNAPLNTPRMGIPARLADTLSMPERHEYLRRSLSRRGLLAATAVAGATGLAASGTARAAGPDLVTRSATEHVDGALVAPFGRHLAYGADPRTQMRVSWQVPLPVRDPFLRIGLSPLDLGHKVPAEVRDLFTPAGVGKSADIDQYYVHAALDNLRPGTTYYYGVGHRGFDPAHPGAAHTVYSFTTAPDAHSRRPFTFTAFGDQNPSYTSIGLNALVQAQNPAFHLHAGDICYAEETGHGLPADSSNYDARQWDQFLAQIEPTSSRVPWMVAFGNHDMEAWYSPNGYGGNEARFTLPGTGFDPEKAPGVYSFVHGNVAVVSVDANDVSYEIPANRGYTDGRQTAWLDRRLGQLRKTPGVDFVVVFHHHCAYSTTSSHASEGGVREQWVPLYEKHQVDLVVNGHNHVYERTDPVVQDKAMRELPIGGTHEPTRGGVVYVTAGAGGESVYSFPVADSYEGHEDEVGAVPTYFTGAGGKVTESVDWSRVRYTGYSFIRVDAKPAPAGRTATLTVRALAATGAEVDRFVVARKAG